MIHAPRYLSSTAFSLALLGLISMPKPVLLLMFFISVMITGVWYVMLPVRKT